MSFEPPGLPGSDDPQPPIAARLSSLEARMANVEQMLAVITQSRDPGEQVPAAAPPSMAVQSTALPPPPEPGTAVGPPPPAQIRLDPQPTIGMGASPPITAEVALRWAGVILVVCSAVFFVSTAINRGWIGPELQLLLATAGGVGLVGTALYLDRRWAGDRRPWSLALANAGVVVLGVCGAAAHAWLGLVGPGTSTVLATIVLALAFVLADRLDHESLAVSGLTVALIGPAVVGAYSLFGELGTGAWMLMLVTLTMALAWRCRWSIPRLLGMVVIGPIMVALASDLGGPSNSQRLLVQLMVVAAGAMWWIAPWLRPAGHPLRHLDQRLGFVVPGLVWLASLEMWVTTDGGRASLALAVAAAFGAAAFLIRRIGPTVGEPLPDTLFFAYLVGASALVSAALALWLEGPVLLSALTVQALGTVILATKVDDWFVDVGAAVLGAVVGSWTAIGVVEGIDDGLSAGHAVTYLAVLAATAGSAWLLRERSARLAGLLGLASWVGLLSWIMAVLRPLPQGQMMVSILWAVLGVAMVIVGLGAASSNRNGRLATIGEMSDEARTVGLATLAATVLKLVTVDLAEVDTIWRALLFAVVGVGLLRLGYRFGLLDRAVSTIDGPRAHIDDDPSA